MKPCARSKPEGCTIAKAASDFGLSRPTIYQAQAIFAEKGVEGLLPHKTGPKHPRQLTPEVRQHLQELEKAQPEIGAAELARRVRQRFNVELHPRTIEKALHAKAKRGAKSRHDPVHRSDRRGCLGRALRNASAPRFRRPGSIGPTIEPGALVGSWHGRLDTSLEVGE